MTTILIPEYPQLRIEVDEVLGTLSFVGNLPETDGIVFLSSNVETTEEPYVRSVTLGLLKALMAGANSALRNFYTQGPPDNQPF